MSQPAQPYYVRPWRPLGIGWIFALLVTLVQILVLLKAVPFGETEEAASTLALALALLL